MIKNRPYRKTVRAENFFDGTRRAVIFAPYPIASNLRRTS